MQFPTRHISKNKPSQASGSEQPGFVSFHCRDAELPSSSSLLQTACQVCQDGSIQVQAVSRCSPAQVLLPGVGPAHLKLGSVSLSGISTV